MLEMLGIDLSAFDKYKAQRNSKEGCKVATTLCNKHK